MKGNMKSVIKERNELRKKVAQLQHILNDIKKSLNDDKKSVIKRRSRTIKVYNRDIMKYIIGKKNYNCKRIINITRKKLKAADRDIRSLYIDANVETLTIKVWSYSTLGLDTMVELFNTSIAEAVCMLNISVPGYGLGHGEESDCSDEIIALPSQ